MEEKILIKSKQSSAMKVLIAFIAIGFIWILIWFRVGCNTWGSYYDERSDYAWFIEEHPTRTGYILYEFTHLCNDDAVLIFGPFALFVFIGLLAYLRLRSYELTVTNKRIYGKVAWGKRVDLPLDSISSTGTSRFLNGVAVATSSGRIVFRLVKNRNEIYQTINNLLIERQQNKMNGTSAVIEKTADPADQLKKFKELLDSGVITQEEFDAKKKQLLGV